MTANLNSTKVEKVINGLNDDNKKVINDFLDYYDVKSSYTQYRNPIVSMLYHLNILDIPNITYSDYEKTLKFYEITDEPIKIGDKAKIRFLQYIYAFDVIKNQESFLWDKRTIKKSFESLVERKENLQKPREKYKPTLSFEQVQNLKEFINKDFSDNRKTMKLSLMCFLIYYTDCPAGKIKTMRVTDFKKGILFGKYQIPERYHNYFDSNFLGFQSMNDSFYKIGVDILGIENPNRLKPNDVLNARKENQLICSECGRQYLNDSYNWVSVNNKIICKNCFEELKKKQNNTIVNNLSKEIVDTMKIEDNIKAFPLIYKYPEFKSRLLLRSFDFQSYRDFLQSIGDLGESYVLKIEMEKLSGTPYQKLVDNEPSKHHEYGYDILSYELDGTELYIEVKTEPYNKDNDFYISDNELQTSIEMKSQGMKYLIYRVHNIFSKNENEVWYEVISDIEDTNKYKMIPYVYKVTINRN